MTEPRANRRPASRQDRGATVGLTPCPGLYKVRLGGKGAQWVPARIYWSVARDVETGSQMDRPAQMLCIAGGEYIDPWQHWPMRPIERDEYNRLVAALADDVRDTDIRKRRTF